MHGTADWPAALDARSRRAARAGPADPESISEETLVSLARGGEVSSVAELYRRHRADALRYARELSHRHLGRDVADDILAEAMRKVLSALSRGHGPQTTFRPYLFTAIRTVVLRVVESHAEDADDHLWDHDTPHHPEDRTDAHVALAALSSLLPQWRRVLWLTEVLDLAPADVAARLGVSASSVTMMSMRAREALRIAYVRQHLPTAVDARCRQALDLLARRAVGTLSNRQGLTLEQHLARCGSCGAAFRQIADDVHRWSRARAASETA